MSSPTPGPEFWVFLPQMRMDHARLSERARAVEAAGFTGLALMDHLQPPGMPGAPTGAAIPTAAALLAATTDLRVGHLVLCDAFRHPAVLAQETATLAELSGNRFELGVGWGSVPDEFDRFGFSGMSPRTRSRRLGETLTAVRALLDGETVDLDGEFHTLRGARLAPPAPGVPLVVGGAGPRLTMPLVRAHADWWNLPSYGVHRAPELAELAGDARRSIQVPIGLVGPGEDPTEIAATARRRLGPMGGLVTGTAAEVAERLAELVAVGFERFYLWFSDFARTATLQGFARHVAPMVTRSSTELHS